MLKNSPLEAQVSEYADLYTLCFVAVLRHLIILLSVFIQHVR